MIRNWLSRTEENRTGKLPRVGEPKWAHYPDTAAETGDNFFSTLVATLAQSIGVDCAWIAESGRTSKHVLRTLAFSVDGEDQEPVEYAIAETPARSILDDTGVRFIPSNVRHLFPRDRMLRDCNASGYADIPLVTSTGEVLGLLAVAARHSLADTRLLASQLRLCANRATGELERRKADADLRAAEERFRLVFEHAPDAFLLLTLDGTLIEANRAAEALTGLTGASMAGHSILLPGLMPEEDIRRAANRLHDYAAGGTARPEEFTILHRDGRTACVESCPQVITVNGERVVLLCLRDITERKIAELKRQAKLDRSNQLREGVLSLATHEAVSLGDVKQMTRHLTRMTCEMLGAVSVSVWILDGGEENLRCLDRFESAERVHSGGEVISLRDCAAYLTELKDSPRTGINGRDSAGPHRILEGPGRFLEAVIRSGDRLAGVLRILHNKDNNPHWDPEELRFVELTASLSGQWLLSRAASLQR